MLPRSHRSLVISLLLFAATLGSGCGRRAFTPPPVAGRSTIEGVVLQDSDGKPVAGAIVMLCRDAVLLAGCSPQVGETTTDENGRYAFQNIPPGEYLPAVRISSQAVFLLQKQTVGRVLPDVVKYAVASGQSLVVPDVRLDRAPERLADPPLKLVYPVSSTSVSDRHPALRWEPIAGAKYGIALLRVDGKIPVEIPVTDHPLEFIEASSITPKQDLDDGLYKWMVYVSRPDDGFLRAADTTATAYFTVAAGGVNSQ